MERHRQKEFPNPFDEDLERKLWVPRRDRIFVPSNHVVRLSYDIETFSKHRETVYALMYETIMHQLQDETRLHVRDSALCDECVGYGTWMGIERSEVPQFRSTRPPRSLELPRLTVRKQGMWK